MSQAILHSFTTQHECNDALTQALVTYISQSLTTLNKSSLLLPGGNTPTALLQQLSQEDLPWQSITISPTDERWVADDSEHSNAQMLSSFLPNATVIDP